MLGHPNTHTHTHTHTHTCSALDYEVLHNFSPLSHVTGTAECSERLVYTICRMVL